MFDPKSKSAPATQLQTTKSAVKELSKAQRLVDIARSRLIPMSELLEYDLTVQNPLFDGEFTAKPDKHLLVTALEKHLANSTYDFEKNSQNETSLVVDFMSLIRKMQLSKMRVFSDAFEAAWKSIVNICSFTQLDIVYDSYIEDSIKYCERQRRSPCNPLVFVNLQQSSFIPVQIEKFWACTTNKENLQLLSREFFASKSKEKCLNIILSGYVTDDRGIEGCVEFRDGNQLKRQDLDSELEEADVRIVPHIAKAVLNGRKRIVVLSNDTDVFILLLYYIHNLFSKSTCFNWL